MNGNFDRIEAYLKKELSASEMLAFEKEMQANKDLADEVNLHKLEWEAMHLIREDELREKMKAWQKNQTEANSDQAGGSIESNPTSEKKTNVFRLHKVWRYAAAIILMIGVGSYFWLSQNFNHQAVLASVMDTPKLNTNIKSADSSNPIKHTNLARAAAAFDVEAYDQAVSILESVSQDNAEYEMARIGLGHALFMQGVMTKSQSLLARAIAEYEEVLKYDIDVYSKDEVEWYLLLAKYAQDHDHPDLKAQLVEMARNENHRFKSKAQDLLEELDGFWYRQLN